MSGSLDPTGHSHINVVKESTTAFGSVAASATQIIDLGDKHVFNNLQIINTLDDAVQVTFPGGDTLDFAAAADLDPPIPFKHNGIIKLHYTGGAPTAGSFITKHT